MNQYYPRNVRLPYVGEVRELGKDGKVYLLGEVIGVYPESRIAKIRIMELEEAFYADERIK